MYTNGEIIIEMKDLRIEITTEICIIIYLFLTQAEAHSNFIALIKANDKFNE